MPRIRKGITVLCCGAVVYASLSGCAPPRERPPAPAAPAAMRPDPRANAAPLLADVLGRASQQGTARTSVQGDLGALGTLTGDGVVSYSDSDTDLTLRGQLSMSTGDQHPVRVTVVDGVGYVNSPLARGEADKPWVRLAPGGQDVASRLIGPAVEQIQDSTNPKLTLAGVEHATKIQASQPDQVDGRPVTRYDLRVLSRDAERTAINPRQRELLRKAARSGTPEVTYQLWVGSDGLPVRFTTVRRLERAGEVTLTTTFRDWGIAADVTPPPADQTGVFTG